MTRIRTARDEHDWHLDLATWSTRPALVAHHSDGNPDRSSFYGDRLHLLRLMNNYAHYGLPYAESWTQAGLEYMQGLACSTTKPAPGQPPRHFFAQEPRP